MKYDDFISLGAAAPSSLVHKHDFIKREAPSAQGRAILSKIPCSLAIIMP